MKTVGIIGGLGPETTSKFYLDVIFNYQKKNITNRAPVVIASVPIPYVIEEEGLIKNKEVERFMPYLIKEAKRLEQAEVDFITMPCNSLHIFIDDIRASVKIPVLSIIEETIKYVKLRNKKRVGVLSSAITFKNRLFENEFLKNNIESLFPSAYEQSNLDRIILNIVKGYKDKRDLDYLMGIIENLNNIKADCVILACTDLQLLNPKHPKLEIFDTMQIFSEASVEYMLR
jgi:aspartate racemase